MSENKRIYLCLAHMSGKEMDFIREAFDTNWVVPLGPNVNGFEEDLKKFVTSPSQPSPQGRACQCPTQSPTQPSPQGRASQPQQCPINPIPQATLPPAGGAGGGLEGRASAGHRAYLADPINYPLLKENAKRMRSNPTEAEAALWEMLRRKGLGAKFRRQHVVGNFIVDFVDLESGLVIEVDGGYHNDPEQAALDKERTDFLESHGFKVLRVTNEDVLLAPEEVERKIRGLSQPSPQGRASQPQQCTIQSIPQATLPPAGGAGGGLSEGLEVVALSAGTAAVHLALLACGVGPGDEVMVQSFTFCASSHPVTYLGGVPVFVDSEPESWNMDPQLLDRAIADRIAKTGRKPKAIVPVYLYGMPARIDEILAVASKYDIPVVEDAAEGFGSRFDGRVCGTFGRYGVLSFNGNKMITTSGGGALICPDAAAKREIMFYATQAREAYPYYQHERIGYNYRMSNICAGIGRGQMTVVDEHIAHHRHVQSLYRELLADVPGITLHENPSPRYDSNFWLVTATLDPDLRIKGQERAYAQAITGAVGGAAGVTHAGGSVHTAVEPNANVEALRLALDAEAIESRPLWKPMHLQPVYAANPAYVNGVSESLFRVGICLPAGPMVSDDDVRRIVAAIKSAIA